MNITIEIKDILGIVSLFAALFYVIQIYFTKRIALPSRQFLSSYLLCLAFVIFFFESYDLQFVYTKHLIPFFNGVLLCLAPLIWVYISSLIGAKTKTFQHFLIPIVVTIFSLALAGFSYVFDTTTVYTYFTVCIMTVGLFTQSGYYLVRLINTMKLHRENIANVYSFTENVDLKWTNILIYGFGFFLLGMIGVHLVDDTISDLFFDLLMLSYIVHIGFNGLKQVEVKDVVSQKEKEIVKEDKSEKNADKFLQIKTDLNLLMEADKPYLNQELTTLELANMLETNSKYLSQTINTSFNESFISYINRHRIEAAKKMLFSQEFDSLTLEAIGNKAGFKSKSSFNTAFKKFTGETPSSFKKRISS